jgi:zinc protease
VALRRVWLQSSSGVAAEVEGPLIVYFYTDWCPYCHDLDTNYLPHPAVQEYLRGVVKVRINPEHGPAERAIADRYGVQGYPRFYVIRNPSSVPRNLQPFRRNGALTPEQFAMVCQQAAPASRQNTRSGSGTSSIVVNGTTRTAGNATRVTKAKVELVGVSRGGQMEGYMKAPNKSLTVLDVHPLGVTKQGFDGHSGWFLSNKGGTRNLKGAELAALRADADFYRDLGIRELYPTTKLLGKTKSGFRELYVVQAVPRGGTAEYFYFDVETGLLFRRDTTLQTNAGIVRAEVYYGDWREVDGIRLPFSITQSMGQMTLGFTVEEVKHNVPLEETVFRWP